MSYTYTTRKKTDRPAGKAAPDPSLDALRSGAVKPTQEQMGRPAGRDARKDGKRFWRGSLGCKAL